MADTPGKMLFETHDLVIGYDEPLSKTTEFYYGAWTEDRSGRNQRNRKTTLLKSILGLIPSLSGTCELEKIWRSDILSRKSKARIELPVSKNLAGIPVIYPV